MKKGLIYVFVLLACLSCVKAVPVPDPADYFVGNYTFMDNYFIRWGADSRNLTSNGSFTLTKISANQVQMTGAWNTLGTIVGKTVSFGFCPQSDASGHIDYTFGSGSLNGDYKKLTFTYTGYGSALYTNGISYPMEVSGRVSATKTSY